MVELLVVMAIMAVLVALTVASFAAVGRRSSREGAAENVLAILRQAQMSAVDGGRGALVRINPAEGTLYGISSKVVAAWHFDEALDTVADGLPDVTPGARNMNGTYVPGIMAVGDPWVAEGAVGLCIPFDGIDTYIDCGSYPIYDQTDGIRIEAYVRPEGAADGDVLGVMGKSSGTTGYALGLECLSGTDQIYALHGVLYVQAADGTNLVIELISPWGLAGYTWHHVALEFDGFEARLLVNGVLVDLDSFLADPDAVDPNDATDLTFAPPAQIQSARGVSLLVGMPYYDPPGPPVPDDHPFGGRIDEPLVLSIAGGRRVQLPDGVPIVASEQVVHFDGQGQLDIAYHAGPVQVAVGDPYQIAQLAANLPAGDTGPLFLRAANPFPPTGGIVLVGGERIGYESAGGLQLNNLVRTAFVLHSAGEPVLFARVIEISPMGIVQRVERLQ